MKWLFAIAQLIYLLSKNLDRKVQVFVAEQNRNKMIVNKRLTIYFPPDSLDAKRAGQIAAVRVLQQYAMAMSGTDFAEPADPEAMADTIDLLRKQQILVESGVDKRLLACPESVDELVKDEDLIDALTDLIRGGGTPVTPEMLESLGWADWRALPFVEARKAESKATRLRARVESYEVAPIGFVQPGRNGEPRFRYDTKVSLSGLLKRVYPQHPLPTFQIYCDLEDEYGQPMPMPRPMVEKLFSMGHVVVGDKHVVHRDMLPGLVKTFPKATDFAAYVGGLCGPLVANGFLRGARVRLTTIRDANGNPMGSDGSGRIHPAHPLCAQLSLGNGAFQIRGWNNALGLFAKGILVMDERCVDEDGNPEIWIDRLQIKGAFKALSKQRRKEDLAGVGKDAHIELDLGVTQIWNKPGEVSWSFEFLERIQDNERSREIIREFLDEFFEKLSLERLLQRACERSDQLRQVAAFAEALGMNPMQIGLIKAAVEDSLFRDLHLARQGAGKKSPSYATVIDNSLTPGTCVVAGIEPGTRVGGTRYPLVLPQGLRTLAVVEPHGYHQIKVGHTREIVAGVVFLNKLDLETGMMGDDDGDTAIIDPDSRVVELFGMKSDWGMGQDALYLIEPEEAVDFKVNGVQLSQRQMHSNGKLSRDAAMFVSRDNRGAVGLGTYWMSCFISLGKVDLARAMAHTTQEFIDQAKRVVNYTAPWAAFNESAWEETQPGIWKMRAGNNVGPAWFEADGSMRMDKLKRWVSAHFPTVPDNGKERPARIGEMLPWKPVVKGKVDPDSWLPDGSPWGFTLVDYCSNQAWERFQAWKQKSGYGVEGEIIDFAEVLKQAMSMKGFDLPQPLPYEVYQMDLYRRSGLQAFGRACQQAMSRGMDPELRNEMIEQHRQVLISSLSELGVTELLTIWVTELNCAEDDQRRKTRVNAAFRAVAWPGSPVLALLGIEIEEACDFLDAERVRAILGHIDGWVRDGRHSTPFSGLAEVLFVGKKHTESKGVPLSECKECTRRLEYALVARERKKRERSDRAIIGRITSVLNGFMKP